VLTLVTALFGGLSGGLSGGAEPIRAPAPAVSDPEHVVVGLLGGRTGAFLTLRDAASRVEVVLATLPGLLYRISTPAGSGLAPRVSGHDGRLSAMLAPTGADGPDVVRIVLNRDVRWDIRLPAGAGEQQLDLAAGRITRVEVGASGLAEIRLPEAAGTVPVTFTGSVATVAMTTSDGAPARIRLDGGAGPVTTPWAVRADALVGEVFQEPGWPTARDRFAIRARSALGSLSLDRFRPAAR
jgi:hypothetical protein